MNQSATVDISPAPGTIATLVSVAALLLLLALTTGLAFLGLAPAWQLSIALSIAVFKAAIVAVVFMRLAPARRVVRVFACGGVAWLSLLLTGVLADVLLR